MACLSPSPSGRRLSELLEEKQEPFSLDLHLLEKGCSARLLDGYDTALCWPAPAADAAAVLRRLTSKNNSNAVSRGGKKTTTKKSQKPVGGILKLLLSKILHGAAACSPKPPALQFSDSFKMGNSTNHAAVAPAPCAEHTECSDSECNSESESYSDDGEKQLSPVSVLEHPFESSPVHAKLSPVNGKHSPSKHAMDVFRELLDAAYSPALLTQLLANAKVDDINDINDATAAAYEDDEDDEYHSSYGYRTSPKNNRFDDVAYWEAQRKELARASELVASEVPTARLDAAAVQPEREDVGAGLADAVLQTLLQELVVDLGSC